MGEAGRDQHLVLAVGAEHRGHVPAEGGRALAQVHRDVEDRALDDAHQLVLGEGRDLEVEAAHGPARSRIGVVVLHELERDAGVGEGAPVVGLGEEAAPVLVPHRAHDLDLGNRGRAHLHRVTRG